ncbi:MAG: RNA methyltransferase [Paludisphaera borealis]|uniref:TrmH family RNA methyltransferase n=1 Tax=Paludisphaera borealis TaxID=1387353 RepID=UPI0028460635|nr:RNA methyltransferase [Paludisphaera borealis]MDR3620847.1 RNA methyltransferase [Paludisphaera borealis]
MTPELITDLDDPRIAVYRSLKATNQTRDLDHFVVEGEKLVERLLASRFPTASVLVTDRRWPRLAAMVPNDVPVFLIPFELIHTLVGFPFHQGVLACGRRLPWPDWRSLWTGAAESLTLVVCPKISNPENLGSIARLGDAFGIDGVLAGPSCPDPLSRRVLRVSMGSALRVPILVSDRLPELAAEIQTALGVTFLAAEAERGSTPFEAVDRPRRVALVLGDEDQGVEPEWVARCARSITIPMPGGASSLNVSTAAAILLYHFTKPAAS